MAGVLAARGVGALVFRGEDGLDELAATARTAVWEVRDGVVTAGQIDAVGDLGLPPIEIADLRGADAAYNARVALGVLDGSERGPIRDTVLLNAAAAIVADASTPGTAQGSLAARLGAGLERAAASIDDGHALAALERWRAAAA
jgi:anthranilate phosphoribosyltransferase